MIIFVINVFRRQGCPHLGQGHGPIVSSRRTLSLDSRALINKSLVLVKYFICGKVSKLFYHHDLYLDYRYC